MEDFLQQVKEDIDVNNISGLFKIDLMDEQVRSSIDIESKNYVSGTLKRREALDLSRKSVEFSIDNYRTNRKQTGSFVDPIHQENLQNMSFNLDQTIN